LAGSSALKLLLSLLYPTPRSSSLIHLQRRHRTKRRESPLLTKEGTVEGISLSARNTPRLKGSFTCRKIGTWDRLFNFPSEGRRAEDFLHRKKTQRLRPGSNPRTREPEASTQTTRPPKPSISPPKSSVHFSYPRTFRTPLSLISLRDTNHEATCYVVSPLSPYVLPLRPTCLIQHHLLKHLRPILMFVTCIL
jgi:hypothetical protein